VLEKKRGGGHLPKENVKKKKNDASYSPTAERVQNREGRKKQGDQVPFKLV